MPRLIGRAPTYPVKCLECYGECVVEDEAGNLMRCEVCGGHGSIEDEYEPTYLGLDPMDLEDF